MTFYAHGVLARRAALLAATATLGACVTGTTPVAPISSLAADAQLLANGLAALVPLISPVAGADAAKILADVQAAAATVAADAKAIAASATPSTSLVQEIVSLASGLGPLVIGLFPGGGTAVTIAQALIALAPTLLSAIGVTSMAPKVMMMVRPAVMTPAMARGVLAVV